MSRNLTQSAPHSPSEPARAEPVASPVPVPVWDLFIRSFHWALAAAVIAGWLLGKFGPLQMTLHFWAGYAVGALVLARLVWGVIGPETARFASFVRGPRAVLRYAATLPERRAVHGAGHNPLGGWSVVALLAVLAAQVGTGLIIDPDDYINVGPLAGFVDSDWNRWALRWHHRLGLVLALLVGLHIAAILFYRFWKREDLVTPMITGRRRGED